MNSPSAAFLNLRERLSGFSAFESSSLLNLWVLCLSRDCGEICGIPNFQDLWSCFAEALSALYQPMAARKKKDESMKHAREAFGITLLKSGHRDIRRLKRKHEPSIHGTKNWNTSLLIMSYLEENPLKKKTPVLDVGCGWGPVGIYCSKVQKAKVVCMDADDEVFPFLKLHSEINEAPLNYFQSRYEKLTLSELSDYKLITGADICFWDELIKPLWKMIQKAMDAGVKEILISDPGRSPFEEVAKKAAKKYDAKKMHMTLDEPSVNGYVLRIRPKKKAKAKKGV